MAGRNLFEKRQRNEKGIKQGYKQEYNTVILAQKRKELTKKKEKYK
jgi:hypothetical protein